MLAGVVAGLFWSVPEIGHLDREPRRHWSHPRLAVDPEPNTGPVLVAVHYTIATSKEPNFLAAMEALRSTRQRTDATSWELYRDAEYPDQFVEIFRVPSWEEHLRQHARAAHRHRPTNRGNRLGVLGSAS